MFFLIVTWCLLASSCLSFRLSARSSAPPTGRIYVKFDIGYFYKNPFRKSKFLSSEKISGNLRVEVKYAFTVASAMNSPRKHYCVLPSNLILPAVTHCTSQQQTAATLLYVHCNNGYTKTSQCYDIRTLPLLLYDMPSGGLGMRRSMDNRNCMFSCSTDY